jgi:hypothetical protein
LAYNNDSCNNDSYCTINRGLVILKQSYLPLIVLLPMEVENNDSYGRCNNDDNQNHYNNKVLIIVIMQ